MSVSRLSKTLNKLFPKPPAGLSPVVTALALMSMAVGAVVLLLGLTFLAVPILMMLGFVISITVGLVLGGWAMIEGFAALERWMERDPRFQR